MDFNLQLPIALGADHAGFEYKQELINWLQQQNFTTKDFGTYSLDSVDYPDFAHPTASAVESGDYAFGILICGSANGVAITANKHQHIRAALCWKEEIAALAKQHNDANIICIPARFVTLDEAKQMVKTFMDTAFEGGRHQKRVDKIGC